MRLVLLVAVVTLGCRPRVELRTSSTTDLSAASAELAREQRALEERQHACHAWRTRAFSADERRALSDDLLQRWRSSSLDAGALGSDAGVPFEVPSTTDARLTRVGAEVTNRLQGQPFHFVVVNDERLDTFSTPDGRVLVTSGLLGACKRDGQLAGVVAHEAAHVFHEHALTRLRARAEQVCLVEVVAAAVTQAIPLEAQLGLDDAVRTELTKNRGQTVHRLATDLATQLAVDGYGPKMQAGSAEELQADRSAAEWMHGAGYDVREYEAILGSLKALSVPHPSTDQRVSALEERRAALPPLPPPRLRRVKP